MRRLDAAVRPIYGARLLIDTLPNPYPFRDRHDAAAGRANALYGPGQHVFAPDVLRDWLYPHAYRSYLPPRPMGAGIPLPRSGYGPLWT